MVKKKELKRALQTKKGVYSSRLSNSKSLGNHTNFRMDSDFYHQLIESIEGYAVFTTDKEGTISSWNSGAQKLLGYGEKDIIGKNASLLFTPEDNKKNAPFKELTTAAEKGSARDERWHVKKSGERFWASGLVFPLTDEKGELRGFTKIMRDLSDKKMRELEQDRLLSIFENAPAFICTTRGKNHVFELANNNYYQLVGHRDIIGKKVAEALPEVIEQGFIKILDSVIKTKKPYIGNEVKVFLQREKNASLEERYVNFVYQPIKEADGSVSGIFVHGVDITEQVLARKKVEESEERYSTLFNSIDEGFCIIEVIFDDKNVPVDYCFLETNKVFEKQTGLKNAINKTARELLPTLENFWYRTYGKVALTGKATRFEHGSKVMGKVFNVYATRLGGDESRKVALLFTDITERKKAAEALMESEKRFKTFAEAMPQMAFTADAEGNITYYNQRWYDYVAGMKGTEGWGWKSKPVHHPDDLNRTTKRWKHSLKTGEPYEIEYRLRRHDGEYRWHLGRALPIRDASEKIIYWLGTNTDIHDQKRAMEQRDDFLGIASHELKTPVTSIKAYGQVLEAMFRKRGDMKAAEQLQKLDGQVNKLTNLIGDLLDVTKIQTGRLQFHEEYFDFNEVVNEVVEEVQRTTEKHHLIQELERTRTVYGDRERIGQVLTNLLSNAIKYSPHEGKIIVSTSVDKKSVTLCVQDFGVGIPEKKQQQVFEQFFRVSGPKQSTFPGLGLGLYISSEIIKREGGRLWVESTEGKGSTFCFSLPFKKKAIKQQKNRLAEEEIKHD